jgi:hypothetical protein
MAEALNDLRRFDQGGLALNCRTGGHSGQTDVDLTILAEDGCFQR